MRANLAWTHLLDRAHMVAGEPIWYQCELVGQEHIDEAVASATKTLELTMRITSARCDDRVKALQQKLEPYQTVPAVADFAAQIELWTQRVHKHP